ncbi:CinA family protein [Rudaeicoccus suwonensis]|uniref:Nicotinamide-nucleotide amidase n=1 Tax=Rudaeicoccus suwonensis TaxID=657409 RepID=A0A561ECK8_9MICO|nr:CinA family protein [Rudaeicoccus suwonensis]TWE13348.1 nicotinamide-nucleotide amidase [Rudaeicoccus suwonensis]
MTQRPDHDTTAPVAHDDDRELIALLARHGCTIAAAESLTGGLVTAALTAVPGASAVVRGGVATYATDTKARVLGVDDLLLRSGGPVQAEVARQMAHGVRRLMGATHGIATTGVAGPAEQDGAPVGRVFIATGWDDAPGVPVDEVRILSLSGDRDQIRAATVRAVLELLRQCVERR